MARARLVLYGVVLALVVGVTAGVGGGTATALDGANSTATNTSTQTIVVAADGSGDYESIQDGVDAAQSGDTVRVRAGVYSEEVVINRSITLAGEPGAVLDGDGVGSFVPTAIAVVAGNGTAPTVEGFTIRRYPIGFDASRTDTDWTLRDTELVNGSAFLGLVDVRDSTGNWTLANVTVRDANSLLIDATGTSGAWTITGSTLRGAPTGVNTRSSSGDWTIADTRIREAGIDGVDATDSSGDWRLSNVTVRDVERSGVVARQSTGNWSVRDSTIADVVPTESGSQEGGTVAPDGVGIRAQFTNGSWTVGNTALTGIENESVNATGARVRGDATGNWWGDPAGPAPGDCVGNVDCSRPLVTPPSGDDVPLAFEPTAIEVPAGETRGLALPVENTGNETLTDVSVNLNNPGTIGIGIPNRTAPKGEWSVIGDDWTLDRLEPGERVVPSVDIEASPERFLDRLGPRTLPVYVDATVNGTGVDIDGAVTVNVTEAIPPPSVELDTRLGSPLIGREAGSVLAGGSIDVVYEVTNKDTAPQNVTLEPGNYGPGADWDRTYNASRGRWDREDDTWTITGLKPNETATPGVNVSVPDPFFGNVGGHWSTFAVATVDGETVERDRAVIHVIDGGSPNDDPNPEISVNTSTAAGVFVEPGDALRFDGSQSYDVDGTVTSYEWDLSGTQNAAGPTAVDRFENEGNYTVELTVTDDDGASESRLLGVQVLDDGPPEETVPDNYAPDAAFTAPERALAAGNLVGFNADGSGDRDGEITEYRWDFDGDGTNEKVDTGSPPTPAVTYTYSQPGTYDVTLTVVDDDGATDTATERVEIVPPGDVPDAAFEPVEQPVVGSSVTFDASQSTPGSGDRITEYRWKFGDGETGRTRVSQAGHVYDDTGEFDVTLTVVDDSGARASRTRTVEVRPSGRPELVDVRPGKPGRLIQGVGLQNTYELYFESPRRLNDVDVSFTGGTVVNTERLFYDGRFNQSGWEVTVDVDGIDPDETEVATIKAVDSVGKSNTALVTYDVVDPPNWFRYLLGPDQEVRTDPLAREWVVVPDPPHQFPGSVFGPSFSIPGGGPLGGSYQIGVGFEYGLEYIGHQSRASATGSGTLSFTRNNQQKDVTADRNLRVIGDVTVGPRKEEVEFDRARIEFTKAVTITYPYGLNVKIPKLGKYEIQAASVFVTVEGTPALDLEVSDQGSVPVTPSALSMGVGFEGGVTLGPKASIPLVPNGVGLEAIGTVGTDFEVQLLPQTRYPSGTTLEGDVIIKASYLADSKNTTVIEGGTPINFPGGGNAAGVATGKRAPAGTAGQATGTAAVRLTRGNGSVGGPSVAAAGGGATAVWTGDGGRKLLAASRSNGSWSPPYPVTDDDRIDALPAVTATENGSFVAWSRSNESVPVGDSVGFDIAVARSSASGWTAPQSLNAGPGLALSPTVAGTETSGGTRWAVAWLDDRDGNLSTIADRRFRYAVLDGSGSVLANGSAPGGVTADLAARDDGFRIGVVRGGGPNGTVVTTTLGADGAVTGTRTYPTVNATDVAVAPDAVAWVVSDVDGQQMYVADVTGRSAVPTDDQRITGIQLTDATGPLTLSYRTTGDGGTPRPVYRVRGVDGWTPPREFAVPSGVVPGRFDLTSNGYELLAVTGDLSGRDVFAVNQRLRPDLAVDATASVSRPAAVGANATVTYAVTNRGDRPSAPTRASIRNRTGTVATVPLPTLGVNETVRRTFDTTLDRSGEFEVAVDTSRGVGDRATDNDADTAVAARPSLKILDVADRRDGDRLAVDVRVRNDGPVPAASVPVRVTAGNATVNGTVAGLGAGNNWTRTFTVDPDRVDTGAKLDVVVDPDDEMDGVSATFRGRTPKPDLGAPGGLRAYEDPQGTRVAFAIPNGDTGPTEAAVSLRSPTGQAQYQVDVPGARSSTDTAYRRVSLAVPGNLTGRNLTAEVRTIGSVDADTTDNAARLAVDDREPTGNATATPLTPVRASGTTVNGSARITLVVDNGGRVVTGERLSVTRDGRQVATESIAVPPGQSSVTVGLPNGTTGQYEVRLATGRIGVEVTNATVPPIAGPNPPTDVDGDGSYEDVTGDGQATIEDVLAYYRNRKRSVVRGDPGRFDFDGDGAAGTVSDALTLYEEITVP